MMIEGCRKYNVPLFIAYYRRALPAFIKVKELIEKGAIGEVRFVKTTLYSRPDKNDSNKINPPWRVVPELSGGGKFVDLASHTLDALDFILGPVKKAKGIALNQANYIRRRIVSVPAMNLNRV
jgi:predicted dehydrogenase